jgi:hypothetical protein
MSYGPQPAENTRDAFEIAIEYYDLRKKLIEALNETQPQDPHDEVCAQFDGLVMLTDKYQDCVDKELY